MHSITLLELAVLLLEPAKAPQLWDPHAAVFLLPGEKSSLCQA